MERIMTGVEGLDQIIGGFPKGRTVLVTGNAGSGKTVFALQFTNQCCLNGLRTVFLATEEHMEDLELQAGSFGWDLTLCGKEGRFKLIELTSSRISELEAAETIQDEGKKGRFCTLVDLLPDWTEVLVIDSLGSHTTNLTPREFKDRLDVLVHHCLRRKITTLFVLDSATSAEYHELALFSVYGAIILMKRENPYTGRRERVMDLVKMRNTSTPIQLLTFDITKTGMIISSSQDNVAK